MTVDLETERIKAKVKKIALNHARKLSDDQLASWADTLRPHAGPSLIRVLEEYAISEDFPNVGGILAKVHGLESAAKNRAPAPLTENERKRSDFAAIVAMLWLHYEHHWRLEDFGGHSMARAFLGVTGARELTPEQRAEVTRALHTAKAQYDRALISREFDRMERAEP